MFWITGYLHRLAMFRPDLKREPCLKWRLEKLGESSRQDLSVHLGETCNVPIRRCAFIMASVTRFAGRVFIPHGTECDSPWLSPSTQANETRAGPRGRDRGVTGAGQARPRARRDLDRGSGRSVSRRRQVPRRGSRPAPNVCGRHRGASRSGHPLLHDPKYVPWRFRCAIPVATGGWHGQSGSFSSSDAI